MRCNHLFHSSTQAGFGNVFNSPRKRSTCIFCVLRLAGEPALPHPTRAKCGKLGVDNNQKRLSELGRQTLIIQKLTGSRQSTQGHILTVSRLRRGNRGSCRFLHPQCPTAGLEQGVGEQGVGGVGGGDFEETRISLEASFKCRWANSHGSALSG